MAVRQLPIIDGWTADTKLAQWRRVWTDADGEHHLLCVPFEREDGEQESLPREMQAEELRRHLREEVEALFVAIDR